MAQMVGDGPNRGKSAPPPRKLPKPKPERERTVADAIGGGKGNGFSDRPLTRVEEFDWNRVRRPGVSHPPALAPRSREAQALYNKPVVDDRNRRAGADNVADMYNNMAGRQRREELRLQREAKDRSEKPKPLTASEWVKLTPTQQAAVQANADLAAAIKADVDGTYKHKADSDQIKSYMDRVKELFGEDGSVGFKGIEFAPNTVAFLNQRGLDKEDLGGRTLDDLVSGDTLFTMDDIRSLTQEQPGQLGGGKDVFRQPPGADNPRVFLERIARGQAQYQEDLAKKLAKGDQLLTGITQDRTNQAAGEQYGARQAQPAAFPDVQPQTLQQIDAYMEALARTDSPIDQALGAINLDLQQRGVSAKEAEQVFQLMQQRSRDGALGTGRWFDGVDFPMRSPVEVAQALGSPALKRMAAG